MKYGSGCSVTLAGSTVAGSLVVSGVADPLAGALVARLLLFEIRLLILSFILLRSRYVLLMFDI